MCEFALIGKNIRKNYTNSIVLNGTTIHVQLGSIYGLVGKNGSGKTTLLRILTGLIQRYEGDVIVGKRNRQPCKISAIINEPALFMNLTAFENLKAQASLLGIPNQKVIEKVLVTIGLDMEKKKPVKNYSLGMKQRLRLGMALLCNPDILILDEPLNGLDPNGIAEFRKLIVTLNQVQGMTIIISSHILSELENTATYIGVLSNGKIVKEFSIDSTSKQGQSLEEIYMHYT